MATKSELGETVYEHAHYAKEMGRCGLRYLIKVVQDIDLKDRALAAKVRRRLKRSDMPAYCKKTDIPVHPKIRFGTVDQAQSVE